MKSREIREDECAFVFLQQTQYYAAVLFNTGMRFEQGRVKQGMEGHAGGKNFFQSPDVMLLNLWMMLSNSSYLSQ